MVSSRTARFLSITLSILCAFAYSCAVSEDVSTGDQLSTQSNGSNFNGIHLNGSNFNGMNMVGFMATGAKKGTSDLTDLRVWRGELIAEQGSVTLHGFQLVGTTLQALVRNNNTQPVTDTIVTYRIAGVDPEVGNDPTNTGSTYLYSLEQWDASVSQWVPACSAAQDGSRVAIPVAAEWDEYGNRNDDNSLFTLACTSGVIAKCYRWGYRPWVTGYGDLARTHWTCTRLARADYCGNGVPFTYDGHLIDVWDNLPAPGPIQVPAPAPGSFDAAWNTDGATCLSTATQTSLGSSIAASCPARVFPTCNSEQAAVTLDPTVHMFRAVY